MVNNEEGLQKQIQNFFDSYQGASDLRTEAEKAKDYVQNEFVSEAAPVTWIEKKPLDWRSFPVLNQFYTSKCVAFTTAKLAMINFFLKTKEIMYFSPNSIYYHRFNKPEGGMAGDDAFKIWKDKGISLEAVCRSNQIQESENFSLSLFSKEVAKGFLLGNHITIPAGDFDRVASTIQATGKGVMCWFYFTSREWSAKYPVVSENLSGPYDEKSSRHSVTAVDFGLINGKEYIKIEDSAHFGNMSERWISREFFTARNFLTKYAMNFNYEERSVPEYLVFYKVLKKGIMDLEVKVLQDILRNKGYFPANISSTETFGSVTEKAVKNFQKANGLLDDGIVGLRTREALLKI